MGCLGVMAKLGPLESSEVCAELRGVLERLMTHLSWLVGATVVGGAAILVAVEEVATAVVVVGVVGAMGVVTVVVAGTVVVKTILIVGTNICCIYCVNCTWGASVQRNAKVIRVSIPFVH